MQTTAWQLPPVDESSLASADLILLSADDEARARFAAAAALRRSPQLYPCDLQQLHDPDALLSAIKTARGVLIHLPVRHDYRDQLLSFAARLTERNVALAVLCDDGESDPALGALCNLPPSTLRRLRQLLGDQRSSAASALINQFALACGLSLLPEAPR